VVLLAMVRQVVLVVVRLVVVMDHHALAVLQ
jgi:hypothetical protein